MLPMAKDSKKDKKPNQAGQGGQPGANFDKDEKKKRSLDNFGYILAWLGFFGIIASAFVKLVNSYNPPKKDDFFK